MAGTTHWTSDYVWNCGWCDKEQSLSWAWPWGGTCVTMKLKPCNMAYMLDFVFIFYFIYFFTFCWWNKNASWVVRFLWRDECDVGCITSAVCPHAGWSSHRCSSLQNCQRSNSDFCLRPLNQTGSSTPDRTPGRCCGCPIWFRLLFLRTSLPAEIHWCVFLPQATYRWESLLQKLTPHLVLDPEGVSHSDP